MIQETTKEYIKNCTEITSVGELRALLSDFDDHDAVVIQTIDMDTGDEIDIFPFSIDVIEGVKMEHGPNIREIRFVQLDNKPI